MSINASRNEVSKFQGVGVFLDNAFWLIGHTKDIYPRMRILAGSTEEWRKLVSPTSSTSNSTLSMVTHVKQGAVVDPAAATCLCKPHLNSENSVPYFDSAEFLSEKEALGYLNQDELLKIK